MRSPAESRAVSDDAVPADVQAADRPVLLLEGERVVRRIPRWARPEEVEAALDEAVNGRVSRERRRERWNSIMS
jgi:hypothetical protein